MIGLVRFFFMQIIFIWLFGACVSGADMKKEVTHMREQIELSLIADYEQFFGNPERKYLARAEWMSGLTLDGGEILETEDSHGGFLGDGHTILRVQYDDDVFQKLVKNVQGKEYWHALPFPEDARGWFTDGEGEELELPEDGFYFLYDRHSEADTPYDEMEIFERYSVNFSAAFLDTERNRLLYIEEDS